METERWQGLARRRAKERQAACSSEILPPQLPRPVTDLPAVSENERRATARNVMTLAGGRVEVEIERGVRGSANHYGIDAIRGCAVHIRRTAT